MEDNPAKDGSMIITLLFVVSFSVQYKDGAERVWGEHVLYKCVSVKTEISHWWVTRITSPSDMVDATVVLFLFN